METLGTISSQQESLLKVNIPYLPGLSYRLEIILKKHNAQN